MRVSRITPEFVTSLPGELEPGKVYVSVRFSTAAHLCACGCGVEVVTPLSPAQWVVTFDGAISMWPSIGNWALPCQSHYVIHRGNIRWARRFTASEIQRNRASDQRALDRARAAESDRWSVLLERFGDSEAGSN